MKYLLLILMAQGAGATPLTANDMNKISRAAPSVDRCITHLIEVAEKGGFAKVYYPGPCGMESVARDCGAPAVQEKLKQLGYSIKTHSAKPGLEPGLEPLSCTTNCCTTVEISWLGK